MPAAERQADACRILGGTATRGRLEDDFEDPLAHPKAAVGDRLLLADLNPQMPPPNVPKTTSSAKKQMPMPMRLAQLGNLLAKPSIAPLPANPITGATT